MELQVLNSKGSFSSSLTCNDEVFSVPYNEGLIYQIIVSYQANSRKATRQQKDRAMVAHSTKKPWKQKGTGRARAGMSSSPLWRGGGRVFPNMPCENFSQKINKKMYKAALRVIFSQLIRENRFSLIEEFKLDFCKTKFFVDAVQEIGSFSSTLLIIDKLDSNILLSSRNVKNIFVSSPFAINPVSLLSSEKILIERAALKRIEGALL